MKHALAVTAIVIAAIALVMSSRSRSVSVASEPGSDESAHLVARLDEIEKRLASIEQQVQAPRLESPSVATREVQSSKPDPRVDELAKRLETLERAAAAAPRGGIQPAPSADERAALLRTMIDEATVKAHDATATEAERLAALRKLRGNHRPDGTDARIEVLDDMLRLAQTTQDGLARADVWRQMSGVTDVRLRQPLLDALAFDKNTKSREEAAETLADFMPDGIVEAALRAASTNDADAGVRKQAASSLAGGR